MKKVDDTKICREALKQQKEQLIHALLPDLCARILADADRQVRRGEKFIFLGSMNYPELNGMYREDVRNDLVYLLRKELKKHGLYMNSYCFVYFKRDFTDALFCIGVIAMAFVVVITFVIAMMLAFTVYQFAI